MNSLLNFAPHQSFLLWRIYTWLDFVFYEKIVKMTFPATDACTVYGFQSGILSRGISHEVLMFDQAGYLQVSPLFHIPIAVHYFHAMEILTTFSLFLFCLFHFSVG